MVCSPAQLAANRKNAALSTGPKTEEGKARSRRNAIKHGLTGAGVAVPDEDASAIDERFEAFEADLKPKNSVAQYLVRRAATLSVRVERCVRHEAAEITRAMLEAKEVEAAARADEVAALAGSLEADPAGSVRQLSRTPEGIAWLIGEWRSLANELMFAKSNRWSDANRNRAERLIGLPYDLYSRSRFAVLTEASRGNFYNLPADDWPDLAPGDREKAARAEIGRLIVAEIRRLEATKAGLDHEAIARSAATAPARALFEASKEAVLARKYEAAAERLFYKALAKIEDLNTRESADEPATEDDATANAPKDSEESGSFFPESPARAPRPAREAQPSEVRPTLPPDRPKMRSVSHPERVRTST